MDETPQQLRRQAEHCRHLAQSQFDERLTLILKTMAEELDQQASRADDTAERRTDDS